MTRLPETIIAVPLSQERKHTLITEVSRRRFLGGGTRAKSYIRGKVGSVDVWLVEKTVGVENSEFEKKYLALKEAGIDVPRTVRRVEGSKRKYLMTDVTLDGSAVYGKGFRDQRREEFGDGSNRDYGIIDSLFLELTRPDSESFVQIEAKAMENAARATNHGVLLPFDMEAFRLVVHPDGTWDIMCLDWEQVNHRPFPLEKLLEENIECTNDAIKELKYCREYLQEEMQKA